MRLNLNSEFKKGFTLIELLVVVAIIGILVGVVLVSLGSARDKARGAAFKTTASSIGTAAAVCCNTNEGQLMVTPGEAICSMGAEPKYPGTAQIGSITIGAGNNCLDTKFEITLTPGTKNNGTCNRAICSGEGCRFEMAVDGSPC